MKKFSILLALALISSASAFAETVGYAGDVVLNAKKVHIDASTATVVRTADTPKTVKVFMQIPMGERVCEETATRMVYGRNPVCGYDTIYRTEVRNVCVRYNGNRCVVWERRLVTFPVSVMRACEYPVTYCVRYGTQTHFETQKVKLILRNAAKLSGSEQETFLLSGEQPSVGASGADFTLKPLNTRSTYEVKNSSFFGKRIKLKATGAASTAADIADLDSESDADSEDGSDSTTTLEIQ